MKDMIIRRWSNQYCACGCGQRTRLHKGIPAKWICGHNATARPDSTYQLRQKYELARFMIIKGVSLNRRMEPIMSEVNAETGLSLKTIKSIWPRATGVSLNVALEREKTLKKYRRDYYKKHLEKESAYQRKYNSKFRLTKKVRLKQVSADELLANTCLNLDAPISYDSSRFLHELIPSNELSPLEALMRKEEQEEEQKFLNWRRNRGSETYEQRRKREYDSLAGFKLSKK